ncbi:hypothetical protein ACLOJK_040197 [Asimina triloba]
MCRFVHFQTIFGCAAAELPLSPLSPSLLVVLVVSDSDSPALRRAGCARFYNAIGTAHLAESIGRILSIQIRPNSNQTEHIKRPWLITSDYNAHNPKFGCT